MAAEEFAEVVVIVPERERRENEVQARGEEKEQ